MQPFASAAVAQTFDTYPPALRRKLLALRALIFKTAAATNGVGALEETLKWGEPAYLTTQSKSGSTVRIGLSKARPGACAVYFNCNTTLVDTFRTLFPTALTFEGNRAIVLKAGERIPKDALSFCIAAALTYHRSK
jgi:Domain of unknown function (DU1801)